MSLLLVLPETAIAAGGDISPPVLTSFDFTPKSVNLNSGAQQVTVTAHVTDATGAQAPTVLLSSDSTTQTAGFSAMTLQSGTTQDGNWSRVVTIPTTAAPGSWTVEIYPLSDSIGNSDSTFHENPTRLTVTNTPPASVRDDPTGVSAVGGDASATVSWTPPANHGSAITGYTVTSSPGGITKAVTSSTTSTTIGGLTNGTAYTFTGKATNGTGDSPVSSPSNQVTPATTPSRVGKPAVKVRAHTALVTWRAPNNGGSTITGYRVKVNG